MNSSSTHSDQAMAATVASAAFRAIPASAAFPSRSTCGCMHLQSGITDLKICNEVDCSVSVIVKGACCLDTGELHWQRQPDPRTVRHG